MVVRILLVILVLYVLQRLGVFMNLLMLVCMTNIVVLVVMYMLLGVMNSRAI